MAVKSTDSAAAATDTVYKFTTTYTFDGAEISEIDIACLDTATAKDLMKAQKVSGAGAGVNIMPETDMRYLFALLGECAGYPIEFFEQLRARDALQLKNKMIVFLMGEE